jgi:cytochrome c553
MTKQQMRPIAVALSDDEISALINYHVFMMLDAEEHGSPSRQGEVTALLGRIKELQRIQRR